jgi:hypothetical protein
LKPVVILPGILLLLHSSWKSANGKTLCIPTIFVSYTGESLDAKTPLLKALVALDKAAVDVCQYFDKNISKVNATLGWEQEYFVVDAGLANARPDLLLTGRTVFGHAPAKGQQLEDHYFGAIPERVYAFMRDFEKESISWVFPYVHDTMKWHLHSLSVLRYLKKQTWLLITIPFDGHHDPGCQKA